MNFLVLWTATWLVLSISSLQSSVTATNDSDYLAGFEMEKLDEIDGSIDMDHEEEITTALPSAPERKKERITVNVPVETRVPSRANLLNERSAGRYCGQLTGPLLKAEVRAVNKQWLLLHNSYWDKSLDAIKELRFRITYMNNQGSIDSFIRLNPSVRERPHQFLYFVRYAYRHEVQMETLQVFIRHQEVLLASADVSNCLAPSRVLLGQLTGTSRGVSSGDVNLLNANAMAIKHLHIPSHRYNLHYWAGYGRVHERRGYIIPVDGSMEPVKIYNHERAVITLPTNHTFYDLDYFAIVAYNTYESVGHVYLNRHYWPSDLLPPIWADEKIPSEHQPI